MQLGQPQPGFANRSLALVESGWTSATNVPDVDVVCFVLVNKSPVGRSSLIPRLHEVTVNRLESGCRYSTWLQSHLHSGRLTQHVRENYWWHYLWFLFHQLSLSGTTPDWTRSPKEDCYG